MWLACFFSILLATIVLSQIVLLLLYNSRFIQVSEKQLNHKDLILYHSIVSKKQISSSWNTLFLSDPSLIIVQ